MSDFKSLNDGLLLNELYMLLIIIYCAYMANKCYVMLCHHSHIIVDRVSP